MISIKPSPSCFVSLALMLCACGKSESKPDEQVTLVRPATSAPAQPPAAAPEAETEAEAPLPEEIPRGVSAPELSAEEATAQAEPEPEEVPAGKAPPAARSKAPVAHAAKPAPAKPAPAGPKPQRTAAAKPKPPSRTPSASVPAQPVAAVPDAPSPAAPVQQPVAAAKRSSVQVPSTDHVHVDVPAGLQGWLDADDRMRPWLGKAISVADSCYAKVRADNPSVGGEIALQVTMHENARPSGRVASASPGLGSMSMCATTRLLGVKMPLFTGTEGETYTVRVRFSP